MIETQEPSLLDIPAGYDQITVVGSDADLAAARFINRINIVAHPRPDLRKHFNGVFKPLAEEMANYWSLGTDTLFVARPRLVEMFARSVKSEALKPAIELVLADIKYATDNGYTDIELRLVKEYFTAYLRNYHPDSTHPDLGKLGCCYDESGTEFVRNEDVEVFAINPVIKSGAIPFSFPAFTL